MRGVRKPTALKILDGDQPCRINRDEPKSPPGLGESPEGFDEHALAAWSRLSKVLGQMGVATEADAEAVAAYCRHYSAYIRATEAIARDGMTTHTEHGGTKLNPLIQVVNESSRQMIRLLVQFGMTPAARSALKVAPKEEEDDLLGHFRPKAPANGNRRSKA